MNINKMKRSWYPVCRSDDLKAKPKALVLFGEPLVLVRLVDNDGHKQVSCFRDVCPHRLVPLSKGSVVNGRLRCLYHGWEYDKSGELMRIPGLPTKLSEPIDAYKHKQNNLCPSLKAQLDAYACQEEGGWIWVRFAAQGEALDVPRVCKEQEGFDRLTVYRSYDGDFIHTIENFLDPVHTAFLHQGIIRSAGVQHMRYHQTHDETGFSTHYTLMDQQNGLLSKLFDPGVNINIATFQLPCLVSIAYCKDDDVLYEISWFFVPIDKGKIGMATNIYIPKSKIPAPIKFNLMRPLIEYAFAQDKNILKTQIKSLTRELTRRRQHATKSKLNSDSTTFNSQNLKNSNLHSELYRITPADLVIDHLLHYIADADEGRDKSGHMVLDVD